MHLHVVSAWLTLEGVCLDIMSLSDALFARFVSVQLRMMHVCDDLCAMFCVCATTDVWEVHTERVSLARVCG